MGGWLDSPFTPAIVAALAAAVLAIAVARAARSDLATSLGALLVFAAAYYET